MALKSTRRSKIMNPMMKRCFKKGKNAEKKSNNTPNDSFNAITSGNN